MEDKTYEKSDVERGYKAKNVKDQTEPAAPRTEKCNIWQLLKAAAIVVPSTSEAQMGPADTTPGEEVAETRKSEKPVEELSSNTGGLVDESEQGECQLKSDGCEGPTFPVNISQNFWSHTLGGKSLESPSGTKCARVGHGQHGNRNHSVEYRG